MTHIMQQPQTNVTPLAGATSSTALAAHNRSGLFTANMGTTLQSNGDINNEVSAPMSTTQNGFVTTMSQKKSLNRDARRRELIKITLENQAFLRRLQSKQSNYNVVRWEEAELERKKLLKNICEYDYIIDQQLPQVAGSSPATGFLPKLNNKPVEYSQQNLIKKKPSNTGASTTMGQFYKKRGYASSQLEMRRESNNNNPRTAQPTPYERGTSLYSGQRDLGSNGTFQVEIFLTKRGYLS